MQITGTFLIDIDTKNSVLIMDNAGFHKSPLLLEMIEKAGHKLEYLPAYSPDLNPIEPKWAQSKSKRRKYKCDIDVLFQDLHNYFISI